MPSDARTNFYEFKSGGVHEKHAVGTGKLGAVLAFVLRQRNTKKTCDVMAGSRIFLMHADTGRKSCKQKNVVAP